MASAPTALNFPTAYYYTGEGASKEAVLAWTEVETGACHYKVEVYSGPGGNPANTWFTIGTVAKGVGFIHIVEQQFYTGIQYRVTCISDVDGTTASTTAARTAPAAEVYGSAANFTSAVTALSNGKALTNIDWTDSSIYLLAARVRFYRLGNSTPIWTTPGSGIFSGVVPLSLGTGFVSVQMLTEGGQGQGFNCDSSKGYNLRNVPLPLWTGNPSDTSGLRDGDIVSVKIESNNGVLGPTVEQTRSVDFTFSFSAPIVLATPSYLVATKDSAFSVNFSTGMSGTAASWAISSTPAGLSFNTSTGVLSGTPTAAGDFAFTVTATNASGVATTASFTLHVNAAALPVISSPSSVSLTQGTAASVQLVATGNPSSFAIVSGTLPTGLSLNTSTGVISGTPAAAGSASVTFKCTNAGGDSANFVVAFTVTALPLSTITSAVTAAAYFGDLFTYQITASGSANAFQVSGLPAGLTTNSAGLISGVVDPASVVDGVYSISIAAINAAGIGPVFTLRITVAHHVPEITSSTSAAGQVGTAFTYQIIATNSPTLYDATNLPNGLVIDHSTGLISGTPTVAGPFSVGLSARNGAGAGTATLTLAVGSSSSTNAPVITDPGQQNYAVGQAVSLQLQARNSPISWHADPIPPGLEFDTGSGLFTGTFTTQGTWVSGVTAANGGGTSATDTIVFTARNAALPTRVTSRVLFLDVVNKIFVESADSVIPATLAPFFQGDEEQIDLYFLKPTGDVFTPYSFISMPGATIRIGIGYPGQTPVAYSSSFAPIAATSGYSTSLNLNTSQVNTLIGTALEVTDIVLEIEATPSGGGPETLVQAPCTLKNDLLPATVTAPTAVGEVNPIFRSDLASNADLAALITAGGAIAVGQMFRFRNDDQNTQVCTYSLVNDAPEVGVSQQATLQPNDGVLPGDWDASTNAVWWALIDLLDEGTANGPGCHQLPENASFLTKTRFHQFNDSGLTLNPPGGAGATVRSMLSGATSLDYPSISAGAEATLTITVTGAVTTNTPNVSLGWSAALPDGIVVKQAWVSAANTVSVRVRNTSGSAIDPGAVTCRATVFQF